MRLRHYTTTHCQIGSLSLCVMSRLIWRARRLLVVWHVSPFLLQFFLFLFLSLPVDFSSPQRQREREPEPKNVSSKTWPDKSLFPAAVSPSSLLRRAGPQAVPSPDQNGGPVPLPLHRSFFPSATISRFCREEGRGKKIKKVYEEKGRL